MQSDNTEKTSTTSVLAEASTAEEPQSQQLQSQFQQLQESQQPQELQQPLSPPQVQSPAAEEPIAPIYPSQQPVQLNAVTHTNPNTTMESTSIENQSVSISNILRVDINDQTAPEVALQRFFEAVIDAELKQTTHVYASQNPSESNKYKFIVDGTATICNNLVQELQRNVVLNSVKSLRHAPITNYRVNVFSIVVLWR